MEGTIRYEKSGKVGVITLDRPAALNALRRDMVALLESTLLEVERAADVRALVIIGEGRAFCAGVDLHEAESDVSSRDRAEAERSLETLQNVTRVVMRLPIPAIAALNGLAVGMGSELSISCDIRVAAPGAYLWFSEAKRGLFQSNGVMYLLPRLIGHSRAAEWMMSARKIRSDELRAAGLVACIFDEANFRQSAIEYAQGIVRNSPLSLRLLKEVGQKAFEASYEEVLALEVEGMKETMRSEYVQEGLRAFAEKREPRF